MGKRVVSTQATGRTSALKPLTVALAGNPNCGKTALFNALTGIRQRTGNWPGVTVDRKEGRFDLDGREVAAIDTPGIYSLDASSLDEQVTRDYLLSRDADLIVNIVDASNLERNLYLTVQMLEMGVPLLIALNMMDVARHRGIDIDIVKLSQEVGCPVVPIVAVTGEGLIKLKSAMQDLAAGAAPGGFALAQDEVVEQAISDMEPLLTIGAGYRQAALAVAEDAGGRRICPRLRGPGAAGADPDMAAGDPGSHQ